jgi:hypothetical protein
MRDPGWQADVRYVKGDVIRDIFGTHGIKWCWRSEVLVRMCGACLSASARLACTRGPHGNMRRGEEENAIHNKYVVGS